MLWNGKSDIRNRTQWYIGLRADKERCIGWRMKIAFSFSVYHKFHFSCNRATCREGGYCNTFREAVWRYFMALERTWRTPIKPLIRNIWSVHNLVEPLYHSHIELWNPHNEETTLFTLYSTCFLFYVTPA